LSDFVTVTYVLFSSWICAASIHTGCKHGQREYEIFEENFQPIECRFQLAGVYIIIGGQMADCKNAAHWLSLRNC